MRLRRNAGMVLLAIYLILVGLSGFVSLGQLGVLLPILAILAGIFILIDR